MSARKNDVQEYIDEFQRFIEFCQISWPNNTTSPEDIRRALLRAQEIQQLVDRFKTNRLFDEVLLVLQSSNEVSEWFLQNCMADPPKHVLKKIIQSNCEVHLMDVGFKQFKCIFSAQNLEDALSDLLVESASMATIVKHIVTAISREELQEFMAQMFLYHIASCSDTQLINKLKECGQNELQILINHVLNEQECADVGKFVSAFVSIMSVKDASVQPFWSNLFKLEQSQLVQMCLQHDNLFQKICAALFHSIQVNELKMDSKAFYINLTQTEINEAMTKICSNDTLKSQLLDGLQQKNISRKFVENYCDWYP